MSLILFEKKDIYIVIRLQIDLKMKLTIALKKTYGFSSSIKSISIHFATNFPQLSSGEVANNHLCKKN